MISFLAVNENQKLLYQDLHDLFHEAPAAEFRETVFDFARTVSKGHGRLEILRCWTIADPDFVAYIRDGRLWPNLRTLVMLECERRVGRKTSRDTRYFIASIENDAALALRGARSLGHRKRIALGLGYCLSGRRVSRPQGLWPTEFRGVTPHRAQSLEARDNRQTRHQEPAPASRLG